MLFFVGVEEGVNFGNRFKDYNNAITNPVAILARGRRVARPPFRISEKFNTLLPSFSSPTQENIFVCILLSVKV